MADKAKPAKAAAEGASKPTEPPTDAPPAETVDSDDDGEDAPQTGEANDEDGPSTDAPKKKKKKSRRKKGKEPAAGGDNDGLSAIEHALSDLSPSQLKGLLSLNPALANELAASRETDGVDGAAAALRKLNIEEVMTGLASSGKNVKDMASY